MRGSTYYVRKRVPVDLAHVEKREQIRLSLDTSDKKIAVRPYPAKLAEIERTSRFWEQPASGSGARVRPAASDRRSVRRSP